MLQAIFIRNFVLHTTLTTINEQGKYDIQEFNYSVRENTYVHNIAGYSENSSDTWNIEFNGAGGIQGIAIGVPKNHVDFHDTNSNPSPPPNYGSCCK